eukprot:5569298-Pleurochrysis_carterae.AAC.1
MPPAPEPSTPKKRMRPAQPQALACPPFSPLPPRRPRRTSSSAWSRAASRPQRRRSLRRASPCTLPKMQITMSGVSLSEAT